MAGLELDREVAGIRCREVLERLSAYLDGELPRREVERVEAHLRGCDRCARFGGAFGDVVAGLRRRLGPAEPLSEEVAARLRDRLVRLR